LAGEVPTPYDFAVRKRHGKSDNANHIDLAKTEKFLDSRPSLTTFWAEQQQG
jgi:hypothetical protein